MSLLSSLAAFKSQGAQPIGITERQQQVLDKIDPVFLAKLTKPLLIQRLERYITCHEPTLAMLRRARLCAPRPEPVLITGETGTGKELIARIMLHTKPDRQFRGINCAGIPDGLFESELFGHVKGAFTGAVAENKGALVAIGDGVAFFDEIGELPLHQQAKLLRAIQQREVTPVGGTVPVPIKCRIVSATNRDLPKMVAAGTFREDLYYRIAPLVLATYPLRDRPDDAELIADAYCTDRDWPVPEIPIPTSVRQSPGNVRALENWLIQQNTFGEE